MDRIPSLTEDEINELALDIAKIANPDNWPQVKWQIEVLLRERLKDDRDRPRRRINAIQRKL